MSKDIGLDPALQAACDDIRELQHDNNDLKEQLKYVSTNKLIYERKIKEIYAMFEAYEWQSEVLRELRKSILRKLDEING